MEKYTVQFESLMLKYELVEPKDNTITRYLGRLKISISSVVQLMLYWFLLYVQTLALKVEK